MKRYLSFIIILSSISFAYSQKSLRFTFALSANDYLVQSFGTKYGYRIGPGIEFIKESSLIKSYSFDILFTTKGTGDRYCGMEQKYIQFPVTVAFYFPVSRKFDLLWVNSAYIAYGYGGISKEFSKGISWTAPTFSDDNLVGEKLSEFDLGFAGGIGLDFGRYIVSFNTELGLIPLDYKFNLNLSAFISLTVRLWNT